MQSRIRFAPSEERRGLPRASHTARNGRRPRRSHRPQVRVCLLRRVDWSSPPRPLRSSRISHRPSPYPHTHTGDDASPRTSCPAHALCPRRHTPTLAPMSSPPPLLPTRLPPSPPSRRWWTACTPSRGCRGGPRFWRPRLVREVWGGGGGKRGVICFTSRPTPNTHTPSGVRLALTPLSLLQARAAASAGPLLAEARAAAAAKSGDKGGPPSFGSVAAEVSSLAKERQGKGVHPAWVVAAPLAQVRRERVVCG